MESRDRDISPLIRRWMPDATEEETRTATAIHDHGVSTNHYFERDRLRTVDADVSTDETGELLNYMQYEK